MENPPGEPKPAFIINFYSWATPIVGLIMLVIGLAGGYFGRPLLTPEASLPEALPTAPAVSLPDEAPQSAEEMMDFLAGQVRHFKGDANAPVTIIEFSDFQCPYCGKFATDVGPQIDAQYVASGDVRFGYWHFNFLGDESNWASEASECAADQDAFWEYHDYLVNNPGDFSKGNLKTFAEELNLDTKAFNECMDSGKYTELVQSQTNIARQMGVQSTPSFIINGKAIVGAQPFEAFQQAIESLLNP